MKKYMNKLLILMILILSQLNGMAQNPNEVEMADLMRSEGKIYVVVGVLLIILLGFFVYLIGVDRKISKIEKEI